MGGAITERDRPVLNVQKTVKFHDRPQQDIAVMEVTEDGYPEYDVKSAWLTPSPFGIPTDLSYRNSQTPASDLQPKFMRDEHVLANLKNMTKSKQTRDHHPAVQQAVVHTLKPYPELLQHYMHS